MTTQPDQQIHLLTYLRELIPTSRPSFAASLAIVEQQAERLLKHADVTTPPTPEHAVSAVRRLRVVHEHSPHRGISYWNGTTWIVVLNNREPYERRRFTLFHEFAHIIWHEREHHLFTPGADQAELAADNFARHVLLPTSMVQQAWQAGQQHVGDLARQFEVTPTQVVLRLTELVHEPQRQGSTRGLTPCAGAGSIAADCPTWSSEQELDGSGDMT